MAGEIELLTQNAAGNSWVDLIPGAVSTGYQAQNTNIEAARNGLDVSAVIYDSETEEIVILPSGPIDVNGVLVSIKSEIRLSVTQLDNKKYYIKITPYQSRFSAELSTSPGVFVPSKNGYYLNNDRILNWVVGVSLITKAPPDTRLVVVKKQSQPTFEHGHHFNFRPYQNGLLVRDTLLPVARLLPVWSDDEPIWIACTGVITIAEGVNPVRDIFAAQFVDDTYMSLAGYTPTPSQGPVRFTLAANNALAGGLELLPRTIDLTDIPE